MQDTPLNLFQKYLNGRINRAELAELMAYFGRPENREQLQEWVNAVLMEGGSPQQTKQLQRLLDGLDDRVLGRVKGLIAAEDQMSKNNVRWLYKRIAVAMVSLLAIGIGFYVYRYTDEVKKPLSKAQSLADIAPGGNRAILTLEGGSSIELDSSQGGVKVKDGEVRYEGGELVAKAQKNPSQVMQYATLATPKGGQYQVTLSDGTNVWLNAASALTYPTQFAGNVREVELVGEGYFDVATDKQRPFIVKSKGQQVRVLGTQFNVNAYPDENEWATTLVEGSVEVINAHSNASHRLKPGQQAILRGDAVDIDPVNVAYYTSWKDGRFTFNRTKLPVILRQIERWYDVEFSYTGTVPDMTLWGTLSRDVMLSELLQTLEVNTGFNFNLEGRRIVMSQ